MRKKYTLLSAFLFPLISFATVINGGNYNGNNLIPNNGDTLSGTFTNVGNFHVQNGVTVYVFPGTILSVSAQCINVEGTIMGNGAGYIGGPVNPNFSATGITGSGPGGGEGGFHGPCVHGTGGGGGAYGGNGGNSSKHNISSPPLPAMGGTAYGTLGLPAIDMGSGGGSGATHCSGAGYGLSGAGGNGGGAIELISSNSVFVTGAIYANGMNGITGQAETYGGTGGGAGAGGGINISGTAGYVTGILQANGGNGGDGGAGGPYAQAGGGGGGGRIKLSANICTLGATMVASGGQPGVGVNSAPAGTAGAFGTINGGTTNCSQSITIVGPTPVCEGDTSTYYVNTVNGMNNYTWTVPGGSNILTGQGDTLITVLWGSGSGKIYVNAGSTCGNSGLSDSLMITVNPLPSVSLTLNIDTVCSSAVPIALSGGTPNGGIFSGNGVSGGNFSAVSAGIGTHIITYTYTDGNTCTNSATDEVVVHICAGVNELFNNTNVTVYPNPFHNSSTLTIHNLFVTNGIFEIYDYTGKKIEEGKFYGNTIVLDRNNKTAGMYSIIIKENNTTIAKEKLVIE
ncbi:MAG: T9SS type A sorting domain-containing protein [Flavobacteriales bacterium]|nr:T9SS type A sorting domain-containing protein [Flavobacteriales bacterium]